MSNGVCIDVANPAGYITPSQYRSLGIQFVRAEIRDGFQYPNVPIALLYGPSTEENYFRIPVVWDKVVMVIIGNEPDGTGESSWSMSPDAYVELYNRVAASIPNGMKICTAGMINGPTFLNQCWSRLQHKPDYVNVHYPNTAGDIVKFNLSFNKPVVVGEWCYYTAKTQEQMDAWVNVLDAHTVYSSWFCLSDEMVPNFGVYKRGRLTRAGRFFRNSVRP